MCMIVSTVITKKCKFGKVVAFCQVVEFAQGGSVTNGSTLSIISLVMKLEFTGSG